MPPPVPEVPTVTLTFGAMDLKRSAVSVASGATVLEPSIMIEPDSEVSALAAVDAAVLSPLRPPPQAARAAPMPPIARIVMKVLRVATWGFLRVERVCTVSLGGLEGQWGSALVR